MTKLSEFAAEIKNRNVARPYLFYVNIVPPSSNSFPKPSNNKLVSMWCHGAMTPQLSVYTNDDYYEAGIKRKFAYDYDYQNLILQFYVDQDYSIKNFFDNWINQIIPWKRNFQFPDDYTADFLELHIINSQDQNTYKYTFKRVYPKQIQSIDLSSAGGGASSFSVEFVFETVEYDGQQLDKQTPEANSLITPENKELNQQSTL